MTAPTGVYCLGLDTPRQIESALVINAVRNAMPALPDARQRARRDFYPFRIVSDTVVVLHGFASHTPNDAFMLAYNTMIFQEPSDRAESHSERAVRSFCPDRRELQNRNRGAGYCANRDGKSCRADMQVHCNLLFIKTLRPTGGVGDSSSRIGTHFALFRIIS